MMHLLTNLISKIVVGQNDHRNTVEAGPKNALAAHVEIVTVH